jgi:trigger factor
MFKTYDELRDDIARQLRERIQNEADNEYRNKIIELLLEGSTLEYPTIMVDREIDNVIRDSTGSDVQSYRAYLQRVGRSEEEFRETFREAAEIRVRRGLVLGKLADTEEIAATVDDIQSELDRMFADLAEDDGRFRNLFDSEMGRETVRRDLINRKTMERLLEIARGEAPEVPTAPGSDAPEASQSEPEDQAPAAAAQPEEDAE